MYVWMYVCMYVYIYIIYMYVYTYIYISQKPWLGCGVSEADERGGLHQASQAAVPRFVISGAKWAARPGSSEANDKW